MFEFLSDIQTHLMDPDRIPIALFATIFTIVIGLIFGSIGGNAHPFVWQVVDLLFGRLGDRLNKTTRTRNDLVFRGLLLSILAIVLAFFVAEALQYGAHIIRFYGLSEIMMLSLLLTSGSVWYALLRLYTALEKDESGKGVEEGAYYAIARSARRNLNVSDNFGITRTAMGLAARGFDKGLVAPVIWYLVGGLPVATLYTVFAALAWRFGKDGFSKGFGVVPLALERFFGLFPSLFAALLITCAALFTPTAKTRKGVASWLGLKNRAPYAEGGAPLSVMAWSLGVSLGGASQDLSGSAIKAAWVGPENATAKVGYKHLRRALFISIMAHILFLAALCGAYLWSNV